MNYLLCGTNRRMTGQESQRFKRKVLFTKKKRDRLTPSFKGGTSCFLTLLVLVLLRASAQTVDSGLQLLLSDCLFVSAAALEVRTHEFY